MAELPIPTGRGDVLRTAGRVREVLAKPRWAALAVLAGVSAVTVFVSFDRPVYVRNVVLGGGLSPLGRARALIAVFPSLAPGDDPLRAALLYLTAGAVGTNVSLLGYHLRHDRTTVREGSGSLVGVALGTLGAGCASCGVAVGASVLSLTGVTAGLAGLPFEGLEFLVLALVVTLLSTHWVAAGLESGRVEGCPVDP
ncbi:hypothetical protein BRD00_12715 [Halobacteriales archaeon QS_8_69_26]|nr:MAG: hypothetical protein BRD00_12715 [Halobacteriales archaeon QS_8_69_26]